ncbi:NAD-dependent epimerase/dehydratase family protein [Pengzhenrongella phosphoraccumulans]|uniref:NAD-dependent epimerase/dehydratase family protein n=1 Tax=Pengzhenrongella phosphoraccumulans TaxID=3114394 RepID=UPI00388D289C
MKVLLTGAAGFIGTAIWAELVERGHDVVAVDAYIPQAHPVDVVAHPDVHRLDVRRAGEWTELLRGVDVVCHQAAMVGAGVTVADLPAYAGHNDLGTAALLAAMHAARVGRIVLASSMVVYGEGRYACAAHGAQEPGPRSLVALEAGDFDNYCPRCGGGLAWETVPEHARLDPRGSYAASKLAQEHYAAAWARQGEGSAIALRYHNVYGPGMPRNTPYSGVAAMFRSSIEAGLAPEVFEDGAQMRDFVHVGDVARANAIAIEVVAQAPRQRSVAYNVCSGRPICIGNVARAVAAGTGSELAPVVTGQYRVGDVRHIVASPALARSELGFVAEVDPLVGLPRFATEPLRA